MRREVVLESDESELDAGVRPLVLLPDKQVVVADRARDRRRFGGGEAARPSTGSWRLLEREAFLWELGEVLKGTWEHPTGTIVVAGSHGLGKTAMVNAGCSTALGLGMTVYRARAAEPDMSIPFGLVRQLLDPTAIASGTDSIEPDLARRIFRPGRERHTDPLELFQHLSALLLRRGAGPTLVAVDDVHWADAESVGWLHFLSRRLEAINVHLLLSTRPRRAGVPLGPSDRLVSEPSTRVFSLAPLSHDIVGTLVGNYLDETPDESFVAACHNITGGNPALVVHLLASVAAERLQPAAVNVPRLQRLSSPNVAASVLVRLFSAGSGPLALLEAVSVLGCRADLRVAAALAGVDGEDAGRIADTLADADLLRSGRPLDFVHTFVRSSVYAEIPPARRSTAHAEAAQLLAGGGSPTEEVVTHLLEAEPKGSAWVVTELIKAARLAIDREDISLAAQYMRRANAEPPQPDQQAKVLLIEAEIAGLRGDHATVKHLLEARCRGADPIEWAATGLKLVELLSTTSDRAAIIELVTSAKDEIVADPDLLVRLELVGSIFGPSRPMSRRADLRLTTTAASNSLTEAQRLGVAYATVCAAADATRTKVEETVDVIVSTLTAELLASAAGPLAVSVITQAMGLLAAVGRHDMCDRALRIAKVAADERSDSHASAAFALGLAESLGAQGRLREADELISEALHRTKLTRGSLHDRAVIVRSQILTTRGEVKRAADLLSTLRFDEWLPDGIVGCTLGLEARGHLHLLDRNWEQALRDFTRSRAAAEDQRITNPTLTSWRSGTCVALAALDRRAEAVEISDEYVDLARRFGAPLQISEALRCAARLAPADVRIQLLREAHDLVAQSGAEIERCHLLTELGRAEREDGDPHGARRHLSHAADLAVRIGAAPLAATAGDELRAAGARPRRLRLSGADSLTPSELRATQLASQGCTNSAIASSLYVSVKTVESHLARAFRKLGVRSRTELTAALDQNLSST